MKILQEYQYDLRNESGESFLPPQGSNLCLFSPMRQSQAQVVIVNNPNYFIKERTPFRRPRRSSHHHLDFVITDDTTDKNIKALIFGGLRNLASPSFEVLQDGGTLSGWRWVWSNCDHLCSTATHKKHDTHVCPHRLKELRFASKVQQPCVGLSTFWSFLYTVGFLRSWGNVQLQKNIQYSIYAFMVEAWESKLSKDTSLMNRR